MTFKIKTPLGAYKLEIKTSGGIGNADLYTKYGSVPGLRDYDCRSANLGSDEVCRYGFVPPGTYYIGVYGRTSAKNLVVKASYAMY
jgi:hypothetical protein